MGGWGVCGCPVHTPVLTDDSPSQNLLQRLRQRRRMEEQGEEDEEDEEDDGESGTSAASSPTILHHSSASPDSQQW